MKKHGFTPWAELPRAIVSSTDKNMYRLNRLNDIASISVYATVSETDADEMTQLEVIYRPY